ncbi:MAG: phosphodiester glycosidase family protein [Melioribacteraceae bacterium]|nr:phosphodiester glycosidase family protein [Melioribacteraceae bacterium]
MLKRILVILLFTTAVCYSQTQFDTLSTTQVGPGIFHTEVLAPSVPWTIDILEIDLLNKYNVVKTVKANDNLIGNEIVSSMASRNSYEGHTVVGAINGDFYSSGGLPIGTQIVGGEILKFSTNYSTIGISEEKKLSLGRIGFTGEVITKTGSKIINQINSTRSTNFLVLYNSFMGATTNTNNFGSEVLLKPAADWTVNDTVTCIVEKLEHGKGNSSIPKGYAVLSGHGTSDTFIKDNFSIGDTIKIINNITKSVPKLKEMMGGYPRIIVDGKNYVNKGYQEEGGPPHTYERHPRTAVGFSRDSTKMYFITVDGRSSNSIGMTLHELADFMIGAGIYHGLNLDGGGSTTMLVRENVVNTPSDGGQRAVGNGMIVITTAPKSDTLSQIQISPSFMKIFKGDKKRIEVKGFDKYYNPAEINLSEVTFSVNPAIGKITNDGLFTAGDKADSGYIYINYREFKDSTKVIIKTIGKVLLSPEEATTDTSLLIDFRIKAWDTENILRTLEKNEFEWSVENEEIGLIDTLGIFKGISEGTTKIFVKYENTSDTSTVTVKINEGQVQLNSFDSINEWVLESGELDLAECSMSNLLTPKTEGFGSMKIVYQYTGNSSTVFYVNLLTDIPIEGVPDSIALDLQTNGDKHQVLYVIEDFDNEIFQTNVKKWATETNFLDVQPAAFINAVPENHNSIFNYPVTLKQIIIKLGSPRVNGVIYRDSLIIDNLRITYPGSVTDILELGEIPSEFNLKQNYPNPFNPATTIEYTLPNVEAGHASSLRLEIFDILGRKIKTLVNEEQSPGNHKVTFDASNLSSGTYFYKLNFKGKSEIKKMLFLK